MEAATREGVTAMVFGDLFLEDVRRFREEALAPTGIEPLFPLWSQPTDALARRMVSQGIRAVLTCVDPAQLPASFVGRPFDDALFEGPSARCRSLWGARGVPHLRVGRARVQCADPRPDGRDRDPGRLRLL